MRTFIILCAVVSVALGSPFTECSPPAGQISSVDIKDCRNDDTSCILKRGVDAHITLNFTSAVDANSISVKAYGIIGGVPLPYPVGTGDACKGSGITCPVKAGTPITYAQSFKVEKYYPALSLSVKWILANEDGAQMVCFLVPVKIQ